jgi:hypothetical protein
MKRWTRLVAIGVLLTAASASSASAQGLATIAGVVKDASGLVLPGVTVEASSPALLEKSRTVVTDGTGQYKIVSLPPGAYTVVFTLSGFNSVRREGVELAGSFVASINADLKVGNVSETITVTAQTPLVDVQSSTVQKVVTKEVVDAIPTGRLGINIAALTPGIILGTTSNVGTGANVNNLGQQDVGGTVGDTFTDLSIHGSKSSEQRQTVGGLSIATIIRFGESTDASPSFTAMQEMSMDTSGADASLAGGGVRLNYVPRDGGNTFRGLMFFTGANNAMQGSNYSTCDIDPATVTPTFAGRCLTGAAQTKPESLQARGFTTAPGQLKTVYDLNPGVGGPIMTDRLWFFFTLRKNVAQNYVPQNYLNRNFVVGVTNPLDLNAATMKYLADTSQPQQTTYNSWIRQETLRLTWQAASKHKLAFYWDDKFRGALNSVNTTTSQESVNYQAFWPLSDQMVQYSAPLTNKLLLEAGLFHQQVTWGSQIASFDIVDPMAIGVTDTAPSTPGQLITNYHGRVGAAGTPNHDPNYRSMVALSYVTGAHSVKFGADFNGGFRWTYNFSVIPYSLVGNTTVNASNPTGAFVPTSVNIRSDGCFDPFNHDGTGVNRAAVAAFRGSDVANCPIQFPNSSVPMEAGVYVQDKWTFNRLTLNGGIRFDSFDARLDETDISPSILTPNREAHFDTFKTVGHRDLTAKGGAAWDVFGDGKTALKVSLGKYVVGEALGGGAGNIAEIGPSNLVTTATRNWSDNNGNFIPDCDLANPAAQGPTQTGGNRTVDTCAAFTGNSLLFGGTSPATAVDPDIRFGWGKRPYSWELAVSAQRELTRGISLNGGYYRRWFGNFVVTDDRALTAANFGTFSLTPSLIPGAPGSTCAAGTGTDCLPASAGGQTLPDDLILNGFYARTGPAIASNTLQTFSSTAVAGSNQIDHWNGFDVGLNARLGHGVIMQGGLSTGFQTLDNCSVVDPAISGDKALVEALGTASVVTCHVDYPWLTQIKFLGSYTVPKADVQVGLTYQSIPGINIAGTYQAPNSDVARPVAQGGLGVLPTGALPNGTTVVSIIKPNDMYGPRLNQLDLRLGKVLRWKRTRSVVSLDIFNLLNTDTVTALGSNVSGNWLAPSGIVSARLMKISVQADF